MNGFLFGGPKRPYFELFLVTLLDEKLLKKAAKLNL
jgi:hypothetical protein